jgi:hypothetical protein
LTASAERTIEITRIRSVKGLGAAASGGARSDRVSAMYNVSDRFLVFVPVSGDTWQLCDQTLPDDDPRAVIAIATRAVFGVDVIWRHGIRAPRRFDRLDDVVRTAADVLSPRSGGPRRPVPIPHRPPARG